MKFKLKLPFVTRTTKSVAREPKTLAPPVEHQESINMMALARRAKADMEARERQAQKEKTRKDLQGVHDRLKLIDRESKRKEEANHIVTTLIDADNLGHHLNTNDGYRVAIIKALGRIRREGFEVLRLFSKNGKYDMSDMGSVFQLFEDYALRRDKYPMLPITPNPVVDKRISKAYHMMLAEVNYSDPVAKLGLQDCIQNPHTFWNNSLDLKLHTDHKEGMCMRKEYVRPQGSMEPVTLEDIWAVVDVRTFLSV